MFQTSSPRAVAARALPVIVLAVLAGALAFSPVAARGDDGDAATAADDPAVAADDAAAGDADLFYLSPAEGARIRAARPARTAPVAAPYDQLVLRVLSNRADLVSGGDALVEVVLPSTVRAADVRVTLNDTDVTSAFAVRPDGRYEGVVTGLALGANELAARVVPSPSSGRPGGRSAAHLTVTNHPISGPVFAGTQLQPWVCAQSVATPTVVTIPGTSLTATVTSRVSGLDGNADANCNAPTKRTLWYEPKAREGGTCQFVNTGASRCFEPYDAANPPAAADIADFTNDRGDTAKAIVQVERGTIDRTIYELATLYDPSTQVAPWASPTGWNNKLLWIFGASAGVSRFQSTPANSVWNNTALRRGFMVATSSLTDHGTNSNDTLGAETVMMVKEHIAETYGPIRYTIGAGCSGGSIMQYDIAAAYPGLVDGIQPNCTFPDTLTTAIEVMDCGLLQSRYYTTPNGSALTTAQRAAINGHTNTGFCNAWNLSFLPTFDPARAGNCGGGWPSALTFDKALRPQGIRCTATDHEAMMWGTTTGADGIVRANSPLDNVGLQYGLKALQSGTITPEQFVRLNEGVGSYTPDFEWVPPARAAASAFALRTAYSAGVVSSGKMLAKTAIIDLRGNQASGGDIHANWRAWEARARLDNANKQHDNQLIWAYNGGGGAGAPGAALALKSFTTLDQWLANVEADTSGRSIEEKIRADKPFGAGDMCLTTTGATDAQLAVNVGLDTPACPVTHQGSPRMAAGGPLSEDVFKCALKPLDFAGADYAGIAFTPDQQARLQAVFPTGVCDFTKPGIGQDAQPAGWVTFANGPGGEPLGPAPVSHGGCPGNSAGNGNAREGECPGQSAGPGR